MTMFPDQNSVVRVNSRYGCCKRANNEANIGGAGGLGERQSPIMPER
jgi:hypothetical protein